MKSTILIVTTLVALTLVVSACAPAAAPATQSPATQAPSTQAPAAAASGNGYGGKSYGNSPAATATPGAMSSASGPATVNVTTNAKYGSILTDAKGMTLYIFLNDTSTASTCTGACANNWPALLTNGAPVAGSGADGTKFGTTTRADGTTQVTYNGHPLYYFIQDKAAGDTNGQGIKSVWYVVSPAGDAIKQ